MTFRGVIKGDTVQLGGPTGLPDGTEVDVQPSKLPARVAARKGTKSERPSAWLDEVTFDAGPTDMSEQVDHYAYGLPKRKVAPKSKSKSKPRRPARSRKAR